MAERYELYMDDDNFLWVKIKLNDDNNDLLFESVTDISKKLSLPKHTVLLSSDNNYLDYNTYKNKLKHIDTGYTLHNSAIEGWLYLKEKEVIKRCIEAHLHSRTLKQIRAFYDKWKWMLRTKIGTKKRRVK